MASRRALALSSSLRRYSSKSSPRISSVFPFDYNHEQQTPAKRLPPTASFPLISIRSFSAVQEEDTPKKPSYRDRARHGAQQARDSYEKNKKKGAKAARKGAKTAGEMLQQYGPVFFGTYMSVYFISWGLIFAGMDSGLLDPVQIMGYIGGNGAEEGKSTVHLVVEYMEKFPWTRPYANTVEENPHFANLGVAWVANKFTEPVRLVFTMAIVPKLARHFGFVKVIDEEHDEKVVTDVDLKPGHEYENEDSTEESKNEPKKCE